MSRRRHNTAWLQIVITASDLICRTKVLAFADEPGLAKTVIDRFRYRVLHAAAKTDQQSTAARTTHRPTRALGDGSRQRHRPATHAIAHTEGKSTVL